MSLELRASQALKLLHDFTFDLVRDHARGEDKVREFELATVGASPDHPDAIADLLQIEAQRLARDIEGYIAELNELGVICKGMDTGRWRRKANEQPNKGGPTIAALQNAAPRNSQINDGRIRRIDHYGGKTRPAA